MRPENKAQPSCVTHFQVLKEKRERKEGVNIIQPTNLANSRSTVFPFLNLMLKSAAQNYKHAELKSVICRM